MKVLTIIGARPQFIKAATVSKVIKSTASISEIIVHTGQHFDTNMSDIFFNEMGIPKPNYNLGIGGGNHGEQTGKMLIEIENILLKEKPDWVLVYGDTNSTLAAALAASKLHIKLAHVEAGLRSFNKKMPEEINRILTDNISDVLFTPTKIANKNLLSEGFKKESIEFVGDVMLDAAISYGKIAINQSKILEKLSLEPNSFILTTIHRANNTDNSERLKIIIENLNNLSKKEKVVLPLHPRTKKALITIKFDFAKSNILFIEPLGYIDIVMLQKNCKLIITDSGGIQKEAYFHKKPCITLRNETEWVELVKEGYNILWKEEMDILKLVEYFSDFSFKEIENLYGKGDAAKKIVNFFLKK